MSRVTNRDSFGRRCGQLPRSSVSGPRGIVNDAALDYVDNLIDSHLVVQCI